PGSGRAVLSAQPAGDPALPLKMMIIDSQVHAYEANTPNRPWQSVRNWPASATGDETVAAMDKLGIDGAIFISAFSLYRYDASYAVEVQRKHPGRFAIVKPVDPDDPAVADVIADWKKTPGAVGIRIMLTKEPGRDRLPTDPGLDRILRAAVRHAFPDIWDPLARVFEAWGFERCLWGTDWTRAFAVVNYEQALEPFLRTERLSESERAMLMGGACAKVYGWSPKNT